MVSRKRPVLAFALIAALVFNALLPLFAFYSGQNERSELASLFGDKVLICTDGSFAWVSWDALQKHKTPHIPDQNMACAACYLGSSAQGNGLPQQAQHSFTLPLMAGATPILADTSLPHRPLAQSLHSRAPPAYSA